MKVLIRQLAALVVGLCVVFVAERANATTIYVDSAVDQVKNNGNCTLREAIQAANTNLKVDTCPAGTATDVIEVPYGYYPLNSHEVYLSSNTTINGAGYLNTTIDLTVADAQVVIDTGFSVALQYLTLADAGILVSDGSNANVNYSRLQDASSWFYVRPGSTLQLFRSEVVDCYSPMGPLFNEGTLIVRNSTIRENFGDLAGAIFSDQSLIISDSTITDNQASGQAWEPAPEYDYAASGVLVFGGTATITGSTIYNNISHNMRDLCWEANCAGLTVDGGSVSIKASVVAGNETSFTGQDYDCANFYGPINSQGYNLLGSTTSTGCPKTATDLTPQNPGFTTSFVTDYYGGVGSGYLPKANSPLVNAIPASNAICSGASRDQRSIRRGKGGGCEPGALERATAILVVDNPASLNAGDQATKAMIEQLGFTTTVADDDTVTAAAANAVHLVVISESVTSTKINTKLKTVSADVIVMEPSLFDDMGMTGAAEGTDFTNLANQTLVRVRAGSNVAQILGFQGTGSSSLFVTTSNQSFGWGVPAASATVHANTNESGNTHATFFDYPSGVALKDGTVAQGHRVGFFAFPGAVAALTTDSPSKDRLSGKGLMRQALLLAAYH